MSLVTKLAQLCIYLVSLMLFFLTFLEIIREPSSEKKKIQVTLSHEVSHKYFQKLPGTNWTLFDIKFGSISDRKQPVGVDTALVLPEHVKPSVSLSSTNRSQDSRILIYNRVPKCASETMLGIIRKLAQQNGFKYRNSAIYWKQVINPEEELSMARMLKHESGTFGDLLFDRHFYVFDFSAQPDLGFDWVNMVREPVSRLTSQFYYLRSPRRWRNKARRPPTSWMEKELDTCVLEGDPECQVGAGAQDLQLTYFCGSALECGHPHSKQGLQLAKYNVEHRFAVVGVMEEFATSVAVLEQMLPRWFRGAGAARGSGRQTNKNSHPTPSQTTLRILKTRLSLDIEFYHFVFQRLVIQNRTFAEEA